MTSREFSVTSREFSVTSRWGFVTSRYNEQSYTIMCDMVENNTLRIQLFFPISIA